VADFVDESEALNILFMEFEIDHWFLSVFQVVLVFLTFLFSKSL